MSYGTGYRGFPPPFGSEPRDEVKIILDDKDAFFDGWAWFLHKMHQGQWPQGRRPPCDCSGGCARCCWTPATMWYDMHRAALSAWQDMFSLLYRRVGDWVPGSWAGWDRGGWPGAPARDCEKPEKLVVTVAKGSKATATFTVFNPTCDTVELEIRLDGFKDAGGKGPAVTALAENDARIVGPGEARKVTVTVDASKLTAAATYRGCVLIKTPFTKRLDVEIQVTA